MHVTAQSTNLESVPATSQQQSLTASESHASTAGSASSDNSNVNFRNSNKKTTETTSVARQHGNLDEEVRILAPNSVKVTLRQTYQS